MQKTMRRVGMQTALCHRRKLGIASDSHVKIATALSR
jgi:hypothetical protein